MEESVTAIQPRIVIPDTDALWRDYLAARYRGLYLGYSLPHTCTTSELDHPRVRPGIFQKAAVIDGPGGEPLVVGGGRIDLQPNRAGGPAAQVRYFYVDGNCRRLGVGRLILEALEAEARRAGINHVWMEARVEAVDFYRRCGYADAGPGPTKWEVIHHRIMERTLPPTTG